MNDAFIASMVLGSVLSATDPVAVSALLNEVRKKRRDATVTGMTSGSPHTTPHIFSVGRSTSSPQDAHCRWKFTERWRRCGILQYIFQYGFVHFYWWSCRTHLQLGYRNSLLPQIVPWLRSTWHLIRVDACWVPMGPEAKVQPWGECGTDHVHSRYGISVVLPLRINLWNVWYYHSELI